MRKKMDRKLIALAVGRQYLTEESAVHFTEMLIVVHINKWKMHNLEGAVNRKFQIRQKLSNAIYRKPPNFVYINK